ncbi:MAG TPA: DUF3021 domain-containing protein [Savagea sp.]
MIDLKRIGHRILIGIAFGGIATFFALTRLWLIDAEVSVETIWRMTTAAMLTGIYFALAAFIFEMERYSQLTKTIIHYVLSLIVFWSCAMFGKWFSPSHYLAMFFIFTGQYVIYWLLFYTYYKRQLNRMNAQLPH